MQGDNYYISADIIDVNKGVVIKSRQVRSVTIEGLSGKSEDLSGRLADMDPTVGDVVSNITFSLVKIGIIILFVAFELAKYVH
jgi:hypothetical protein